MLAPQNIFREYGCTVWHISVIVLQKSGLHVKSVSYGVVRLIIAYNVTCFKDFLNR